MAGNIREPAVAGMFYERDRKALRKTLAGLFSNLKTGPRFEAVVSPHAGYAYSGRTAARAISSLREGKRFIILGPNHTGIGSEFSLISSGSWKTPLGDVRIDSKIAKSIEESGITEEDGLAHFREHSIEVQLPFLQHRFGREISFVPISIMGFGYTGAFLGRCEELGSCLAGIAMKSKAILIASSDFSHFISMQAAKEKDLGAIEKIKELDLEGFFRTLHESHASVCGYAPIAVLMAAARKLGWRRVEVLDYTSSGEATGDMSEVVAYASIGFRK